MRVDVDIGSAADSLQINVSVAKTPIDVALLEHVFDAPSFLSKKRWRCSLVHDSGIIRFCNDGVFLSNLSRKALDYSLAHGSELFLSCI